MIPIPSGVRVWLATGHTDMRRGMNGLSLQVQEALGRNSMVVVRDGGVGCRGKPGSSTSMSV